MSEFNFRMLRLARDYRGLTQTALGNLTALPQARLSRLETGQTSPDDHDLRALVSVLSFPREFFFEPGVPAAVPLFRKRAIRSARRLNSIQARLNLAVLVAERLLEAGVDIEPPQYFPSPGHFSADEPSLAAAELRRDWRLPLGRVDDVTQLIETTAGIVLRVDFGSDDASAAFIATRSGSRLWFLVNSRETAGDRVRLSLAHELGHAVLHRMLPTIEEGESELQAFQFATALLLPADQFDAAVPYDALTLARARDLKGAFGVSIQAIVRAAYDRGRITRDRYSSLFKQLSARQWRVVEPDPVPLETPHLWGEVLRVHREEHGYADASLAIIARVPTGDLGELFPDSFPPMRALRVVSSTRGPVAGFDA